MRAVIWIIVGVLVVAAVVFVVVSRSQNANLAGGGQLTAEQIRKDADRLLKRADEFVADKVKLQDALSKAGKLNDAAKAKLADLEAKAAQVREKAQALGAATGKAATGIKREITGLIKEMSDIQRDLKKEAGG